VNVIASAACFILAGLGVLTSGLQVASGESVVVAGAVSSTVFEYASLSSDLSGVLGFVFLAFGLFLVSYLLFIPRVEMDEFSIGDK